MSAGSHRYSARCSRRVIMKGALGAGAYCALGCASASGLRPADERPSGELSGSAAAMQRSASALRVALCHLDVQPAALTTNCEQLASALRLAAARGADWALTPELCLTGYHFEQRLGQAFISPAPDPYMKRIMALSSSLGLSLLLGHLERDPRTGAAHNTLFAIDAQGRIRGRHRKINTIPQSEDWSTPGPPAHVHSLDGITIGMLLCADAWPPTHAAALQAQGAELLLSAANWAEGVHGPGDTWEQRSAETGLPLIVCNRTGVDEGLDFRSASSVVCQYGRRIFDLTSKRAALGVLTMDVPGARLLDAQQFALPQTH